MKTVITVFVISVLVSLTVSLGSLTIKSNADSEPVEHSITVVSGTDLYFTKEVTIARRIFESKTDFARRSESQMEMVKLEKVRQGCESYGVSVSDTEYRVSFQCKLGGK